MKEKNGTSLKVKNEKHILDKKYKVKKPLQGEECKETSQGDWWDKYSRWEETYGKYQSGEQKQMQLDSRKERNPVWQEDILEVWKHEKYYNNNRGFSESRGSSDLFLGFILFDLYNKSIMWVLWCCLFYKGRKLRLAAIENKISARIWMWEFPHTLNHYIRLFRYFIRQAMASYFQRWPQAMLKFFSVIQAHWITSSREKP